MRIGIDLLGSDSSPEQLAEAAVEAANELGHDVELLLFGTSKPEVPLPTHVHFHQVTQEITTDESPLTAVRHKRNSSLVVGLAKLACGELDGFVSAGNTGALVTAAALTLPLLPGVKRPALLAELPSLTGSVAVVDVGANVVCKPHHLLQFAKMGVAYKRSTVGIERPKLGLLNIGTESKKGTTGLQEAYHALKADRSGDFTFVGNIEGREAFSGCVDVLVSDGFSGNVFLKTAEGISNFILDHLADALGSDRSPEVAAALESLNQKVNYAEYPGAIVCGVEGVVVKCHGFSSKKAVVSGIRGASRLIKNGLIARLKESMK